MWKTLYKRILPATLILIVVLELGSKLILNRILPHYRYRSEPNRTLSGYYVFKNRPGYTFSSTFRSSPDEPDAHFDEFGFIKDFDTYEKDSTVYRVFLCGGSAMVGAGQTDGLGYERVYDYPKAIYSFPSTIAGQLQKKLQARYPSKKIQVVNTAAYMRLLHHSHILYLETITHLSPDLVVSMDGYNDLGMLGGPRNPYYYSEQQMLPQYLSLYYHIEHNSPSNFLNLLNYATKKMTLEPAAAKDSTLQKSIPARKDEPFNTYFFQKEMRQFCANVRADSADFLFVFQPVLSYASGQKLSQRELALKQINDDEFFGRQNMPKAEYANATFDSIGNGLTRCGGYYLNANTTPAHSGGGEMFTDYCHFTAWGNERVANLIFEKIVSEDLVK